MRKTLNRLTLILFISICFACETDVDITAPEEDIPVAYALLDHDADTQFVRVNRLLQGNASFADLAGDRAASEYESVDISLTRVEAFPSASGGFTYEDDEFLGNLTPIEVRNKEESEFHFPNQTVYYTAQPLESDEFYKITIITPEGTEMEGVTGMIEVPRDNVFERLERQWRQNGIAFIQANEILDQYIFRVSQPVRARAFELKLVFPYKDIGLNNSGNPFFLAEHKIEIPLGQSSFTRSRARSGDRAEVAQVAFNPLRFYESIERNVPDIDDSPEVVQRVMDSGRVEVTFISDDIQLYSEVARPSESILEDKPSFTNWSTGVGVIGSRAGYTFELGLNRATLEELKNAQLTGITGRKGFCNAREPNDCLAR